MEIIFSPQAEDDRTYWKKSGNKQIMKKISALLADMELHPFTGLGKPEALRENLSGYWSRRINAEHRIIYSVHDKVIEIYVLSMRYHYPKSR